MERCSDFPARLVIIEKSVTSDTGKIIFKRNSITVHSQAEIEDYVCLCQEPSFRHVLFKDFNRFGPFELDGINYGSFAMHSLIIERLDTPATILRPGFEIPFEILEGLTESW